jgi:hypothetical protein
VGLTRQHVRETVLTVPSSFPRAFTLREIIRRGFHTGPVALPRISAPG